MKYLNLSKYFATLAISALVFSACDKVDVQKSIGDAGQTLVKILGGGSPTAPAVVKKAVDFVNVPKTLLMADVRRDVQNATVLNTTMKITVKDDPAAVALANPAYVILPAAWYTIGAATPKDASGNFNLVLAPGEFAKEIQITIPNATLLNPSTLYALGFTITSADNNGVLSQQLSVVVEIGAKNKYDGIYAVTGPMVDLTGSPFVQWNNPAYPDPFPQNNGGAWEGQLITSGANTCQLTDNTIWGCNGHPMLNAGANSGFGSFGLVIDFDPATDAVIGVHNYYGDPAYGGATALGNPQAGSGAPLYSSANTRRVVIDPSGVNARQANKDVLIKYFMVQPSVVPAPPSIRVTFNELWKYIGPR